MLIGLFIVVVAQYLVDYTSTNLQILSKHVLGIKKNLRPVYDRRPFTFINLKNEISALLI